MLKETIPKQNNKIPEQPEQINPEKIEPEKKQEEERVLLEKVKKYARDYFEEVYSQFYKQNARQRSKIDFDIQKYYAKRSPQVYLKILIDEDPNEQIHLESLRKAVMVFLDELIAFLKEKQDDEKIDLFLEKINHTFFIGGDFNIASCLDFKNSFHYAAKLSRFKLNGPERMQTNIGFKMVENLANQIVNYCQNHNGHLGEKKDELWQSFQESSMAEKLDKLNLLEILHVILLDYTNDTSSVVEILQLLDKIKANNKNVFINHYLDVVREKIKQAEQILSERGIVFVFFEDRNYGRLGDDLSGEEKEESKELEKIVIPNRALRAGEKIVRLANDVIAIVDYANLPIEYYKISKDDLQKYKSNDNINATALINLKDIVEKGLQRKIVILLDRVIENCNEDIFKPRENISNDNPEELAFVWSKFTSLPKSTWQNFFQLETITKKSFDKVKEFEELKKKELEKKESAAALRFLEDCQQRVPGILKEAKHYNINNQEISNIEAIYNELIKKKDNNYKVAFRLAEALVHNLKQVVDPNKMSFTAWEAKYLLNEFNRLEKIFLSDRSEYSRAVRIYENRVMEEYSNKTKEFSGARQEIYNNEDKILIELEAELNSIIEAEKKRKKEVNFVPFDHLVKKEIGLLKDSEEIEDTELLLKHLYRPAMKQRIEKEFGLSLKDLSFSYHIFFLKFLAEKDEKEVEKVKDFLQQAETEVDRKNRVKTFLSLEFDQQMGEQILAIGQQLKNQPQTADKLFAEFARLVDSAEAQAQELVKMYEEIFFDKKLDRDKANYAILRKAFALLNKASQDLAQAKKEQDKEKIISNLIADLRREEKVQKKAIEDLKGLQKELNKFNKKFDKRGLILSQEDLEKLSSNKEKLGLEFKVYYSYSIEETGEVFYVIAPINSKYDSKRIQRLIDYYKEFLPQGQFTKHVIKDMKKEKALETKIKKFKKSVEKNKNLLKKSLEQLENLFNLQQALEQKLDEFIYGHEQTQDLPAEVKGHLSYKVLEKYSQIVEQAKKSKQELRTMFKKGKNITDEELDKLTQNLLARAKQLLFDFSKKITQGEGIKEEELIKELENYKADLILTASVWKAIDKSDIRLEDLEGVSFEKLTVKELTQQGRALEIVEKTLTQIKEKFPEVGGSLFKGIFKEAYAAYSEMDKKRAEEILQMFNIYFQNYKAKPKLQQKLLENFLAKLKQGGEKIVIYLYKKTGQDGQEHIIAFNRFDVVSKDKRYFGSFNVPPSLANSAIGTALLKVSLEEQKRQAKEIEADCEPEKFISSLYIEKYGFVVKKVIPDYEHTGIIAFNIVWQDKNKKYYYRDYEREDIIKEYEHNFAGNRYRIGDKFIILKFGDPTGAPLNKEEKLQAMLKETASLINEHGYVMSRYFFTDKQKEVYCILERGGN